MLVFTRKNYQQLNRLLGMSLVVLLMALFMAPDAFAGKPACNLKKNPDGCPGTDPGPTPGWVVTEVTPTKIWFSGGQVSSGPDDWSCNKNQMTYANGLYTCPTGDEPIRLHTDGASTSRYYTGKHRSICESVFGYFNTRPAKNLYPDDMNYGWTDGCYDGSCAIEINIHFSDDDNEGIITGLTNGKANTLGLVLHGIVDTALDPDNANDSRESNPFYFPRDVAIDSFDMDFRMDDDSRTAGLCTVYTSSGGNTFFSLPPEE